VESKYHSALFLEVRFFPARPEHHASLVCSVPAPDSNLRIFQSVRKTLRAHRTAAANELRLLYDCLFVIAEE
jgi:hypothetical protein